MPFTTAYYKFFYQPAKFLNTITASKRVMLKIQVSHSTFDLVLQNSLT